MKKTLLSLLVGLGALAATQAFAQGPGSIDQYGREFRPSSQAGQEFGRESGRESGQESVQEYRGSRAGQGQRRPSQRDFEVRAQRSALSNFDGAWSVAIITRSGTCEPQYRFGVQIINGNVVYEGETTGRVSPNGSVQVAITQGDQRANGQGRLSRDQGSGVWRGVGSAGPCAGTWVAERRD